MPLKVFPLILGWFCPVLGMVKLHRSPQPPSTRTCETCGTGTRYTGEEAYATCWRRVDVPLVGARPSETGSKIERPLDIIRVSYTMLYSTYITLVQLHFRLEYMFKSSGFRYMDVLCYL